MTHALSMNSKLFNLELKDDDPLALASEIRGIMHNIETTSVKMDVPLKKNSRNYITPIPIILSHYKVSKYISPDSLMVKFSKGERFWEEDGSFTVF